MKTLYDNKHFTIKRDETNKQNISLWIDNGWYATSALVYDNNTVGYDNTSILTKAIRRAVNTIVERETGKPALVNINIMNEKKTYKEHFNL